MTMREHRAGVRWPAFQVCGCLFPNQPTWLLATAATWGSARGHGKGGQEVAVQVYAPWKVLKQSVSVEAIGCGVSRLSVHQASSVRQKSGRYNGR